MANLQSSGAISILDLKNFYGGPASPSLLNYYKGNGYVQSTYRQPASGDTYSSGTYWDEATNPSGGYGGSSTTINIKWGGASIVSGLGSGVTSYTAGGYTYYRGTLRASGTAAYATSSYANYGLYRTSTGNSGVPTSGAISLSNFYGGFKPD